MLRRLVTLFTLAAFALATPAFAASSSAKKPASKSSNTTTTKKKKKKSKKSKTVKKSVKKAAATPAPVAAPVKKGPAKSRAFIRTSRAGWQEVIVGDKVIATREDGSKVSGTIREVSDYSIVIEPKKTRKVTIASNDLAQVFHDAN